MKILRTTLFAFLAVISMQVLAYDNPQQKLQELFHNGEKCYLTDDYYQLKLCIDEYVDIYYDNILQFGDSADVYEAYLLKMRGNYYYGLSNNDSGIRYVMSEYYYKKCFDIFDERDDTENTIVIRQELAQLYYKIQDYENAILQLDKVSSYFEEQVNYMAIKSSEPKYYRTLSQQAICNACLGNFDKALQQIEIAHQYFEKNKDGDYYETLRRWGKILMMQADQNGTTDFQTAKKYYERYVNEEFSSITQRLDTMSSKHRSQHWLATHRFLYYCCRLGNHAPELIYNLALFSKGFLVSYENNRSVPQFKWQQVQKKLAKTDCAIEFVQYFGEEDQ